MKYRFALPLLALGLVAAAQPLLAAKPKSDPRAAALVAALQAVSADPLGGRLGLEIATVNAPTPSPSSDRRTYAVQSPRAEFDHRTYVVWKSSQKS
jgi:hypothetical protein